MNGHPPPRQIPTIGLNWRTLNKLHLLFWLLSVLACVACRTSPPLPPVNLSATGWTLREGQVVWRPKFGNPEIAGELLVATHSNGERYLQFTKTPLPFVVARITTNRWHLQFVADHREFSGRGPPPPQLGWLHLARCVTGDAPMAKWHWETFPENRWRLQNRTSGETFEGFLSP